MGTKATLGGVTLVNAKSVSWSLSVGVDPHVETFVVHGTDAVRMRALLGDKSPVTLEIAPDGFPKLTVKRLYVIGEAPPPEPYLAAFYVADGRWLWRREWVYRHFNMPRRTGNRRLIGGIPTEIDTGIDSFAYADWSLKDPGSSAKKWTSKDALQSILAAVTKGRYTLAGDPPEVPLQNVEHDDAGPGALRRILAHIGGWDVVMDYDGDTVAFDANDLKAAAAVIAGAGRQAPIEGSEIPVKVDLSKIRPANVISLFDREVELRINSVTENESVTRSAGDLDMENVAPAPDVSTTITEGGKPRTVSRGTWVPLRLLLAAWNGDLPAGASRLTFDLIRKLFAFGSALEFQYLRYDQSGVGASTFSWAARLATIRAHWRVTYQIAGKWMRRIKGLRAKRLGVYDPVSGVFAPAGVFMDYATLFSLKGLRAAGSLSTNVHGFPGVGTSVDGSSARQAPAILQIYDQDLGIVHIELRPDLQGFGASLYPGFFVDENDRETSFTYDPAAAARFPMGRDVKVRGTNNFPGLSSTHRVAIVLTAIPASPNDEARLHDVKVPSGDASALLGASVSGSGRDWTVRIGSGLQTARILWIEGQDQIYRRIFGVDDASKGIPTKDIPASMVVNSEILTEAAKAKAAELLSKMVDHYDGSKTSHWDVAGSVVPRGNIDVVTHTLSPDGRLTTTVRASPTPAGRDLLSVLPDSIRTAVFRILPTVAA